MATLASTANWTVRPDVQTSTRSGSRTAAACAAVFFVVWIFSLSRSLFDPIGYDQALYQYMAERVMAGERLYVDVWDQNAPGIVAVHWLATHVAGGSPLSLRAFDAAWQALTLAALAALAVRDGRRWPAAWLATALYALCYYSMGYVQTAQREGFAVLPLLLSVHLFAGSTSAEVSMLRAGLRCMGAGVLGLFVFMIKPPLGLCFGVLWLYALAGGVRHVRRGVSAFTPAVGLTAGCAAAAAVVVALLMHLESWEACREVLSRRDMQGYVLGPGLVRGIVPLLLAAGVLVAATAALLGRSTNVTRGQLSRLSVAGLMVSAMLISCRHWPGWQHVLVCFSGLWIPAFGFMLLRPWARMSEISRLVLLILAAATLSVILQGRFFLYHLPPMLAPAAYLAAVAITDTLDKPEPASGRTRAFAAVCLGSVVYLAVGQWWPTMAFVTAHPCVLAGSDLSDHYDAITKHKLSSPKYSTTLQAAARIRELTGRDEPIACLFHEARIYYFARRPSVHRLIAIQPVYAHLFPEYMEAIRRRRPKVIVARVPEPLRQASDLEEVESAVFNEAERVFGPSARCIRELYHVTELIGDLCLLQPVTCCGPDRSLGGDQNIIPCQKSM